MNVILIGFRCAGKSSVGRALAQKLGREFVDCDEFIEKKTNLTIREIFDIAGESYFRMLEGDALADLGKLDGKVIATGGGAALKYKNIRNLKRNGVVLYLDASPHIVLDRIRKDPQTPERRPPLTDRDPSVEIREQMDFRRPYYVSAADFIVQTDSKSVTDSVKEILQFLKGRGFSEVDDSDAAIA